MKAVKLSYNGIKECEMDEYGFVYLNGKILMGKYKQGLHGKKVMELPLRVTKIICGIVYPVSYFVNSSRQVKDPNAYFLGM